MYYAMKSWQSSPAPVVSWHGGSGRSYVLHTEDVASFSLTGNDIYVLTGEDGAEWVGTGGDVIGDSLSRARFRRALASCSSVLRLVETPQDDAERNRAAWDLENGHPVPSMSLAQAG